MHVDVETLGRAFGHLVVYMSPSQFKVIGAQKYDYLHASVPLACNWRTRTMFPGWIRTFPTQQSLLDFFS